MRECREKADISQETLAEMLDISVAAVSNFERGVNYPSMEKFLDFLKALNPDPNDIFQDYSSAVIPSRACELSEKLKNVSPKKHQQILDIVEILLEFDN